jgi:hypothetical protein
LTFGFFAYIAYNYYYLAQQQKKIMHVPEDSVLFWKLDKLALVETPRPDRKLINMLQRKVGEVSLLEALTTLRLAEKDDRIKGLIVDLSTAGQQGAKNSLGMAQLQELREAIHAFSETKKAKFGEKAKTVAVTDTFGNASLLDSLILMMLLPSC